MNENTHKNENDVLLESLINLNPEQEFSRNDLLNSRKLKNYLLVLATLSTLSYGTYYFSNLNQRGLVNAKLESEIDSEWENYLENGIPSNINISPLSLLLKNDFAFLADEENSHLFTLTQEETDVLNSTNNYQELREILKIPDANLRVKKIVEYLQVEPSDNPNGNDRYSSNLEDGTCNLYLTDILDLIFYGRTDDFLSYRTDLNGYPITNPIEILKIDNGEKDDFVYNNANSLLKRSEYLVANGKLTDATNFNYEDHLFYLDKGYAFIIFLVNEDTGLASHAMFEFGIRNDDGSITPARTQATRNVLASEVTNESVIFLGDTIDNNGVKYNRYPRVFMFKIPELN